MGFTDYVKDAFMAPEMSDFRSAEIPGMSHYCEESPYWLSHYILNSVLRGDYKKPFKQYAFNFLRKAEGAFREHALARVATITYVQSTEQTASVYMQALQHWEQFVALAWQGYNLLRKFRETDIFTKDDGSAQEHVNVLYNASKHDAGATPDATIPVWLTREGLCSSRATLTFLESAEVLKEIAEWASILQDPPTAKDKLHRLADSHDAGEYQTAHENGHDPRRAEILESLVELYLRLNGYFCVRNWLHHRVDGFGLDTESDVLAIRMPHQHEELADGRRQPNDENLILTRDAAVDCIIGEVKESSVEFNSPLRGQDGGKRIAATLRMFGVLPDSAFENGGEANTLAEQLHRQIVSLVWDDVPRSQDSARSVSVRMLVFAPPSARHADKRKFLDLQHVLDFVRYRMRADRCARYRDPGNPGASPWRGCTRFIIETLDASYANERELELETFMSRVLRRYVIAG